MSKVESFDTEAALMDRIGQIKSEGIQEEHMTVIANSDLQGTRSKFKNVRNETKDIGLWEKFVSWFSVKSLEEKEIDKLELSEHEKYIYRKALEDNKLLLYINEDEETFLSLQSSEQL